MPITATKTIATRIGCDHAVAAILTEGADGTPTYGEPKALPGLISVEINPNTSTETLFADDGPMDTATTLGNIEVSVEKNALSLEEKAFLLGHSMATNETLIFGSNDAPPWVAFGFRTLKGNNTYKYVWLYKGKFTDGDETATTKGDSIEFQTDKLVGSFAKLTKLYTVGTKQVYPYKIEFDTETAKDKTLADTWFNAVVMPT